MITVRSIIVEALNRSNLVSRRQSAPADMVESGYRLLKGIAGKFSNDNLLQFLVADVEVAHSKHEYVVGESDAEYPEEYLVVDIPAPSIQSINTVYWETSSPDQLGSYVELKFASTNEFDSYPSGTCVYTWKPLNDKQLMFKTKLLPSESVRIKIYYNKKWDFDLDSTLRIPAQFEELFIVALTHKLAVTFPRLSTEQVQIIKSELDDMIRNVSVSSRAVKYLSRKPTVMGINREAFYSGTMFLGG